MATHGQYHIQYWNLARPGWSEDVYHCTEVEVQQIRELYENAGHERVEIYQLMKVEGDRQHMRIVAPPAPPAIPTRFRIKDRYGRQVATRKAFTIEQALDKFLEFTGELRDERGLYAEAC